MSLDNPPEVPPEPSFIINNDELNDDTQTIITDLYTSILYLNRFSKTQMNGGYLQISYFMPSGTMRPNATYMSGVNVKKYKCANLYIFKASHRITMDGSFDGELVVELIPIVNTSEKLYLCFLLKNTRYSNNEHNDIDELIKNSVKPPMHYDVMNFNLQNIVEPKQKKIIYKSGIDTVVIFLSPISINEVDFSSYSTISERLFAIYPVNKEYKMILPSTKEGFTESFREGVDGIDIQLNKLFEKNLVTCRPVDYNDKTDDTAVYLADTDIAKVNAQSAIGTALIVMFVEIGVSFFLAPQIFKYMLSDIIIDGQDLTTASCVIVLAIFILGLTLIIDGTTYDTNETWVGLFILIFLTLSVMSIAIWRKMYPNTYGNSKFEYTTIIEMLGIMKSFIVDMDEITFSSAMLATTALIVWILVSIYAIPIIFPSLKYTDHSKVLTLSIGIIYISLLVLWIASVFSNP
jgi:hypothetical protein